MKKTTIILFLLIIISCTTKLDVKSEKLNERQLEIVKKEISKGIIDLNGKYTIVSYEVFPKTQKDTLNKYLKTLRKNGYKFNFSKREGIVHLDSTFGMQFFSDTVFNYRIKDKYISLKNKDKKIEFPYKNDAGIIRLLLHKNGIKQITIHQPKK